MFWEPYILQSKRHVLDTSTERLNPVFFDKDKRLPANSRGVEKSPLCSKKIMMDFIGILHNKYVTFWESLSHRLRNYEIYLIKIFFISTTDALVVYIYYIKIKIYMKIHTKIAPTCFDLTIILREHIIDLS